jgi:hypothetical protein
MNRCEQTKTMPQPDIIGSIRETGRALLHRDRLLLILSWKLALV